MLIETSEGLNLIYFLTVFWNQLYRYEPTEKKVTKYTLAIITLEINLSSFRILDPSNNILLVGIGAKRPFL